MSDEMRYVKKLAGGVGPRPAGTNEEQMAALYLADFFKARGLSADIEEFTCSMGSTWAYVICYALTFVAALISNVNTPLSVIAFILAIAALALLWLERSERGIISGFSKSGLSQNVIARHIPEGGARERRARPLVIIAHYDTHRNALQGMPLLVDRYPLLRSIVFAGCAVVAALCFLQVLPLPFSDTGNSIIWLITFIAALPALIALIGLLIRRIAMRYSDGANDNASGVAAMMGVADRVTGMTPASQTIDLTDNIPAEPLFDEDEGEEGAEETASSPLQRIRAKLPAGSTKGAGTAEMPALDPEQLAAANEPVHHHTPEEVVAAGIVPDDIDFSMSAGAQEAALIEARRAAAAERAARAMVAKAEENMRGPAVAVTSGPAAHVDEMSPAAAQSLGVARDAVAADAAAEAIAVGGLPEPESFPMPEPEPEPDPRDQARRPINPAYEPPRFAEEVEEAAPQMRRHAQAVRLAERRRREAALAAKEKRDEQPQEEQGGVPSWWRRAESRRAEEQAERAANGDGQVRSRFADLPIKPRSNWSAAVADAAAQPEPAPEPVEEQPVESIEVQEAFEPETVEAEQPVVEAPAPEPVEAPEPERPAYTARRPRTGVKSSWSDRLARAQGGRTVEPDENIYDAPEEEAAQERPAPLGERQAEEAREHLDARDAEAAAEQEEVLDEQAAAEREAAREQAAARIEEARRIQEEQTHIAEEAVKAERAKIKKKPVNPLYAKLHRIPGASLDAPEQPEPLPVDDSAVMPDSAFMPSENIDIAVTPLEPAPDGPVPAANVPATPSSRMRRLEAVPGFGGEPVAPGAGLFSEEREAATFQQPSSFDDGLEQWRPAASGTFAPIPTADLSSRIPVIGADGSFDAPMMGTGTFAPVGDPYATGQVFGGQVIDDADDLRTYGATPDNIPAASYVDIPDSRTHRFFDRISDRFSGRGKKADNRSAAEWLGVDEDFDARAVGRDIGSWDNFDDDDWKGGGASTRGYGSGRDSNRRLPRGYNRNGASSDRADRINPERDASERVSRVGARNGATAYSDEFPRGNVRAVDGGSRVNRSDDAERPARTRRRFSDEYPMPAHPSEDFEYQEEEQPKQAPRRSERAYEPERFDEPERRRTYDEEPAEEEYDRAAREYERQEADEDRRIRDAIRERADIDFGGREVWFVATGASGAGHAGVRHLLANHTAELSNALIINIECVGSGEICAISAEGSGKTRKADSRLVGLLLKTAKGMGLDMRARWLGWRGTDATPMLERKLRAVSIMGLGKTAPIGWSWGNDSASNVDPKRIEAVADLIARLIQGGR